MSIQPTCPKCVAKLHLITYGLPTEEAFKDPEFVSGGCIIEEDAADYRCLECENEFREDELPGFYTGSQ